MSEIKVPKGYHQIGMIMKGGGINVAHFVEKEEKQGNKCVDCGDYVMVCKEGKPKR